MMYPRLTVLVCGGRDYANKLYLFAMLDLFGIERVVHGGAPGADTLAGDWARQRGVPADVYLADWPHYGPKAGPLRNTQMLREGKPAMVLAFPGGRGTADMVKKARAAGIITIEIPDK